MIIDHVISHPNKAHPSQRRFSPTSLETACPRKYYFEKVIGLQPIGVKDYFSMGTSIHAFVENWQELRLKNKEGEELLAEAVVASLPTVLPLLPSWPGDKYSLENWLFTCEAYHNKWKDDGVVPLKTESIVWIPMINNTDFGGVIDMIYERPNGSLIIRDTKTTGRNLTDWFWKGMENKFQLSAYYYMASQLFPDRDILGVEIDAVVISNKREKDPEGFHRRIYDRTELQIADMVETYRKKTNYYMEGLELSADSEKLTHFYCEQSQCSNYGGCPFLPICSHGLNTPAVRTDFRIKGEEEEDGD